MLVQIDLDLNPIQWSPNHRVFRVEVQVKLQLQRGQMRRERAISMISWQ